MPGLTVSCKIVISEIPDTLYIPLEALFKDVTNDYVYVKSSSGFKRRNIKIGDTNTDFAIVMEGLEENEELALSDPFLIRQNQLKNKSMQKYIFFGTMKNLRTGLLKYAVFQ